MRININQGGYATGTRSGIRDKSRPNWRQVAKAKLEAKARKDEDFLQAEEVRNAKERLFVAVRLASRMYTAGFDACKAGDSFNTGYYTALRREGLYDSAISASSSDFFERAS